jgi:biopolymer transport protein ExbD
MIVQFPCPNCRRTLKAQEAERGRRAKCTYCGTIFRVPGADGQGGSRASTPAPSPPPPAADGPPIADGGPALATAPFVRTAPPQDDEIDMTPMIDVVFQLLIFFMVTSSFALQKALPIPSPESVEGAAQSPSFDESNPDDVLVVRIDADDGIWVDDVLAVSRQDLIAKIRRVRMRTGPAGEPGPRRLLVSVDPDAHHEAVVTALDAGSSAGMEEVRLRTEQDSF